MPTCHLSCVWRYFQIDRKFLLVMASSGDQSFNNSNKGMTEVHMVIVDLSHP